MEVNSLYFYLCVIMFINKHVSSFSGAGRAPLLDFGAIQIPGNPRPVHQPDLEDPLVLLEIIKNNPHERSLLKERNPPLSDALESGNSGE